MEREILFRGKRVIDGKWIESCCPLGEMHSGTVTYDFISATVCQYTGLTDNTQWEELSEGEKEKFLSERNHVKDRKNTKEDWNGRKIFEGDICEFSVFDYNGHDTQYKGVVVYCGSRFMLWKSKDSEYYGADGGFDLDWTIAQDDEFEVIGSIFGNEELLNQ